MPTIYLVRHGEKITTENDPELTDLGKDQASRTGQFLSTYPISKIIASPMIRTQQTAEHIAKHLNNITVESDERLKERMEYVKELFESRQEFFNTWFQATHDRDFEPKSGVSSNQRGQLIRTLVNELPQDEHVVLVTHGGAIADFLRTIFNEKTLESLQHTFPEGRDYRVNECSITRVQFDGTDYYLEELHCTSHLE